MSRGQLPLGFWTWNLSLVGIKTHLQSPYGLDYTSADLYPFLLRGWPNAIFMQCFPFKVSSGICSLKMPPSLSGWEAFISTEDKQQNVTLTPPSDALELLHADASTF